MQIPVGPNRVDPVVRSSESGPLNATRPAWLMLTVGENRQHGGNAGYSDEPDLHYVWDDTVANHSAVAVGDAVVLWNKAASLGASVIEAITLGEEDKTVYRCPNCGRSSIKPRRTLHPRYKCYMCKAEFETPVERTLRVGTYRTDHGAGWVDLNGALSGSELRRLCVHPASQHSMRPLRWADFRETARSLSGISLGILEFTQRRINGGHRMATVRVRIGQAEFRRAVLGTYGQVCAFTGPTPLAALEAAHLYSYAATGRHHDRGGFMVRSDIHRLFDTGLIAVDPATLRIDVARDLESYDEYHRLHRRPIKIEVTASQLNWLREHWAMHRSGMR